MKKLLIVASTAAFTLLMSAIFITSFPGLLQRLVPKSAWVNSKTYRQIHGFYLRQSQQITSDTLVTLGDSHIQGLNTSLLGAHVINFGIGRDRIPWLSERVKAYEALSQAKGVILLIGANDILNGRPEHEIEQDLQNLSDRLESTQQLYWLGVLPASKDRSGSERILWLNRRINTYCREMANCRYIAPPHSLSSNGDLADEQHIGDGVHLTAKAYRSLANHIKQQIEKRGEPSASTDYSIK